MGSKSKANDPIAHYAGIGIVFGAAIGWALDAIGTGVGIGLVIGAGIGTWIKKKKGTDSQTANED